MVDGQRELEPEQEHNENEETDPSTAQESPRSPAETIADALADLSTSSTTIAAELVLQQSSTSGPSEASQEDQQEEPAVNVRLCSLYSDLTFRLRIYMSSSLVA